MESLLLCCLSVRKQFPPDAVKHGCHLSFHVAVACSAPCDAPSPAARARSVIAAIVSAYRAHLFVDRKCRRMKAGENAS